ncbi:MAG: sigma-70 family RNA polymerase sigma factor [Chloroflexi bacterium]|nr:sigma-70 family RNA polymerase sigma factor [Chloroflexota bacterium]
MDDLLAIKLLKRGEIEALEALVLRYEKKAIRTAYFITHDEALARDVVQDVFLQIYRAIRRFDETRRFEPYLLQCVVNASLNAVKKSAKQISLDEDLSEVESLLSEAASAETEIESRQFKAEVLDALSKLHPRQRAAVVQRYYLEMNEKEMSASLGIPAGTVKWLLSEARTKLRNLLGSERRAE